MRWVEAPPKYSAGYGWRTREIAEQLSPPVALTRPEILRKSGSRLMPEDAPNPDTPPWDPYREGKRVMQALREAEGGAYSIEEACASLGISLEQLKALYRAKELVSWADDQGRPQIPKWQFRDGKILPGIGSCLRMLGEDPAGHLKFFLAPSDSAGGLSPLELLQEGKLDDALAIAREVSGT